MAWRTAAVLGSADVRRIAEWYRDELGFTLDPATGIFQPPGEDVVYGIVSRDGAAIHFQLRDDGSGVPLPTREDFETDVYVYVDDVDALYDAARKRGVRILREMVDEEYGMRDFAISDPDDHHVAFGSPKS
jgi:uncharacterized glyoxalase superfamily protein PhnB